MVSAQEKKIFTIQGPYPIIRRELRARGWVERRLPGMGRQLVQHHGNQNKQRLETGPSNSGGGQTEALLNPCGGTQPFLGTTDPLHYPWLPTEEEEQCDEDPNGIHNLMVSRESWGLSSATAPSTIPLRPPEMGAALDKG